MKKVTLNNIMLDESRSLSLDEKKNITGGAAHYEYVCFYCGGPNPICIALRIGIDPEPC